VINLLVADDHVLIREGLKRIISTASDIAVVEEAADGNEALQKILDTNCDIALLDISMPGLSGIEILQQLKKTEKYQSPRIIILSVYPEDQYAERALREGAFGYLLKKSKPDELLSAIRTVYRGEKYISRTFAQNLALALEIGVSKLPHETLSHREYQVMCMIGMGKTVREIAEELSIGVKTVGTYHTRILEKMGMKTNVDLARYVMEHKLHCE